MTVGIVGLGLIGGSVAKSIRAHSEHEVIGFDRDPRVMEMAIQEGAIVREMTDETIGQCDVVLAALYPAAAVQFFREKRRLIRKGALAMDLAGVKRAVCDSLFAELKDAQFTFMGGHPMAGREFSGYTASRADLFEKACMLIAPMPGAAEAEKARAERFFREIGFARVRFTDPDEHDHMIALTSQLAHVVSSAYVKSPLAPNHSGFSAGSFHDMTRVARLNERMWTELMMDNRQALSEELAGLIGRLQKYQAALDTADEAELMRLLKEGRLAREALDPQGV